MGRVFVAHLHRRDTCVEALIYEGDRTQFQVLLGFVGFVKWLMGLIQMQKRCVRGGQVVLSGGEGKVDHFFRGGDGLFELPFSAYPAARVLRISGWSNCVSSRARSASWKRLRAFTEFAVGVFDDVIGVIVRD